MNIKIQGINLATGFDPERRFTIAAFGDVAIADIETTFRGCALAWHKGEFIAMPPKVPGSKPGDVAAIQWRSKSEFAMQICEKLLESYVKFGGKMPTAEEKRAAVFAAAELEANR